MFVNLKASRHCAPLEKWYETPISGKRMCLVMNNGRWKTCLIERQICSQSELYSLMTAVQGLKIVSPPPVTFAKPCGICGIQGHSRGEQLVLRNPLPKGAESWNPGRYLCPGPRRAADLAGEEDFFKYSEQTPQNDPITHVLLIPHSSRCLQLAFQ